MNISKDLIDYELIDKMDVSKLRDAIVLPIKNEGIYFKCFSCENSNFEDLGINNLIKNFTLEKETILFFLSDIDFRINLYRLSLKILNSMELNENYIKEFCEQILNKAIFFKSSDIHIESLEKLIVIRFRIDGELSSFFYFNKKLLGAISSYIKMISKLEITQNRVPMDGRFTLFVINKKFDFRVSTMPTIHGESIVIRILDNFNIKKEIEKLGFNESILKFMKEISALKQGLVLVTGPTGSGKSTTLYSLINKFNSENKKIITIEDPVEYKIEKIQQIEINDEIGLSFDIVLKNILRQDPDIILIGEIRDKKSLSIALQASLTGHLVLASIHANNSLETLSRLFDLSADNYLLSSTLKYIISQRLVLKICKKCNSQGCDECNYKGFKGRTTIAEVMSIDKYISKMILNNYDLGKIREYLQKIQFKTIFDDGISKVKMGITNNEQLYKVVDIQ